MSLRNPICVVLAILCCSTCVQTVQAGAAMSCSVRVNGQEAFDGVIVRSGHRPKYEDVAFIGFAKIRPIKDSPYQLTAGQALQLKGDIELAVREFPSMQMKSLSLVPSTITGNTVSDWSIDPVDVAKINAFYKTIGDAMQKEEEGREWRSTNLAIFGAPTLVFIVATLLCVGLFFRRGRVAKTAEK